MVSKKLKTGLVTVALFALTFPMAACLGDKAAQWKIAIYTAQADAALVALTDSISLLNSNGRISAGAAKAVYVTNLRAAAALDIVRDRAKTGFDKKSTLAILDGILTDIQKAESEGVIGLNAADAAKFKEVAFFAQFTVRSIQAVVQAIKEPAAPTTAQVAGAIRPRAQGQDTVWTGLVLILQTAVLRGIEYSRLSASEAFTTGASLSTQLKNDLSAKIAAL